MKKTKNKKPVSGSIFVFSFLALLVCLPIYGQEVQRKELLNPFDFPALLSGNFGELRGNHFHSGIDFKTQGAEGKAIHVVASGYISRISVSPGGYGNALYVNHPDGTTTVYGHILRFNDKIAAYVKEQQYQQESFSVNLSPTPEMFPVVKGDIIALSGNTGSSGGPHLHFEVRDTQTEELLDPLPWYQGQIRDSRAPRIQGVMVYPVEGAGIVNGKSRKQEFKQITTAGGEATLTGKIEAWGKIGLAVKAYDYMSDTHHVYGVREITLLLDGQEIFHSRIDRFSLAESRYLNSLTDYAEWIENRSFYMKSFIEPGNKLRFLEARNRGYITINEERPYDLQYILKDLYGNETRLAIRIMGKEQLVAAPDTANSQLFYWAAENRFGAKGIRLTVPKGNLYDYLYFRYSVKEDSTRLAATHVLHDTPVALHRNARLSLRLQKDPLENKKQYGITRLHRGRTAWIGGTYRTGWLEGDIRELGQYTLAMDTVPPTITPIDPATWTGKGRMVFRLTDNLSGVDSYRGEIDGAYVLFERDNRSLITYRFDKEKLSRGRHVLRLTVTDGCGNESSYSREFTW